MKDKLIYIDCDIPDHNEELIIAADIIKKLKERIQNIQKINLLTEDLYIYYHKEINKMLDYVAGLSTFALNASDKIEKTYKQKYKKSPELAKILWVTHYHNVNKPYNRYKNMCFDLLETITDYYIKKFNKNPIDYNEQF